MKPFPRPTFFYQKTDSENVRPGSVGSWMILFLAGLSFFAGAVGSLVIFVYFFDTFFSDAQGKTLPSWADVVSSTVQGSGQDAEQARIETVASVTSSIGAVVLRNGFSESVGQLSRDSFLGDGVFVTSDGYFVTNAAVFQNKDTSNAGQFGVLTSSGTVLAVERVIPDPFSELMWIRTESTQVKPVVFADVASVLPGIQAYTLNVSPSDVTFHQRFLSQVFSPLDDSVRSSEESHKYLFLDAATDDPVGTPVFTHSGSFLGFTQRSSDHDNLVVPSLYVRSGLASLLEFETKVVRPSLGVHYVHSSQIFTQNSEPKLIVQAGDVLTSSTETPAVVVDSAAEKAGLLASDRIVRIEGESVQGWYDTELLLQNYRARDTVTLSIDRSGDILSIIVLLSDFVVE